MTLLCVPIFVTDFSKARRDIAAAAAAGADIIELRIDKLSVHADLGPLLSDCPVPVIVTCRSKTEGGFSELDDAQRGIEIAEAFGKGARYGDVEIGQFPRMMALKKAVSHIKEVPLILSFHDFNGLPDDICRVLEEMERCPATVNKLVWTARNIRENLDAFRLLRNPKRPTVALCMGEAGLISRVLAKKFGAFLTFAALDASEATAPGQVAIADMRNLYRWDAIGPQTKVFGVVAHPVRHSMSPAIHNAAFDQTGFDGVYLPLLVEPDYESFNLFMRQFVGFEGLNLSGLSVTIPHKENALRYLRETGSDVEESAARIGAVNTIAIDPSGKLSGSSTDYAAILDSITSELGIDREGLRDLRVAVLGAGGTGRTAVAALAHFGADVAVCNRNHARAQSLASEFDGQSGKVTALSLDALCRGEYDVLINSTSVGMFPKVDQSPLGDRPLPISARTVVFDAIYNPMKTVLLRDAEARGCRTIGGVEMFLRQAAGQFELWTGLPAPMPAMRAVITQRLSGP